MPPEPLRGGAPLGPSAVPGSLGKAWRPLADRRNSSAPIRQGPSLRAWVTSVWRPGPGPPGAGLGGVGCWQPRPGSDDALLDSEPWRLRESSSSPEKAVPGPGPQSTSASHARVCGWTRLEIQEPLLRFLPGLMSHLFLPSSTAEI